jgi:hypothetical protein
MSAVWGCARDSARDSPLCQSKCIFYPLSPTVSLVQESRARSPVQDSQTPLEEYFHGWDTSKFGSIFGRI